MQKETVKIDKRFGEDFEGVYEFRQVTQGEYERVLVSYMDALGKVTKQDILKVNREMLFLGLTKQPEKKPLNKERVVQGQLPYGLGVKLQEAYDKANGIAFEEQRFLSSPSDGKSPILDSQNSSSAKSSDGPNSSMSEQAAEQS